MKNFEDMKYIRPDEDFFLDLKELIEKFNSEHQFEKQNKILKEIELKKRFFITMSSLCHIRYTINTEDEFYKKEKNYFIEKTPTFDNNLKIFHESLLNSKNRRSFEDLYGKTLFKKIELSNKNMNEEIMEDLTEEEKLANEYVKLTASAKINFENKKYNISQMTPFMACEQRDERKKAWDATYNFFYENIEKFDSIYDELVKKRTKIAKKLGYKNFIQVGYNRMGRLGYGEEEVKKFRNAIKKYIVPITQDLIEKQKSRINIQDFKYYDLNYYFQGGNPYPKDDYERLIEKSILMYDNLSKETSEFFRTMKEYNLFDLKSKKSKATGGYCTYLPEYKVPFIFANFNGTDHDIKVLTHETGHAFNAYITRNFDLLLNSSITMEIAEIHSMSMEFFTWKWMESFYDEETEKAKYLHLIKTIFSIPYMCTVDEFQHEVYKKPELSALERRKVWRELEKEYTPYKNYEGNKYLEDGGYWQKQLHIYRKPFYYIDYALARICSYQFLFKSLENFEKSWDDYMKLNKFGAKKEYIDLLESSNLKTPFEEKNIKEIAENLKNLLDKFNF